MNWGQIPRNPAKRIFLICTLLSSFMLCSLLVPSSNGTEDSPMFDMNTTAAALLSDYCIQVMILPIEKRLNISLVSSNSNREWILLLLVTGLSIFQTHCESSEYGSHIKI